MSQPWVTEADDTIALLQDEIGRLEEELRLQGRGALHAARTSAEPPDRADDEARVRRFSDLTAAISLRDESITLLLEQVRLFEEAESTARAEQVGEQLNRWVQEVERRVENRDTEGRDLLLEMETERNRAEALRMASERERGIWETQRQALEEDIARLRTQLTSLARRPETGPDAAPDAALVALEHENRRLRETCQSLVRTSAEASEAGRLRHQLGAVEAQLDAVRRELRQALDDRERERIEHEAALAASRSRAARESLKSVEATATDESKSPLAADERIRALRQHLCEIHEREEADRLKNRLAARLSRLWHHTSPSR